jgi:5-methylthioadenosine/S-adenosylhomocysteine deaminase
VSQSPGRPIRLEADWLIPIDGPPLPDAAVLVDEAGRIAAAGPSATVSTPPDAAIERCPGAAILPGLVNAHTHLELTGLGGRVEHDQFPQWIRGVRELKAGLDAEWFAAAARRGVRDAFAAGITTVLDTGDSGAVLGALVEEGGAGVVYQEVFGPHPDQLRESLTGLESRVAELGPQVTDRVRLGLSPHAPYTVSGPLYRATAELARRLGLPLAVHLAESREESSFVGRSEGPFAEGWRGRGIPPLSDPRHGAPDPDARRSPVSWLERHGVLGPDTLVIHAVQLDPTDLALLARLAVGVAHCPLSNARHRHGTAPLAALLRAGIRVGVGTDSVMSVGLLDLFREMRAARSLAGLTAAEALALGTLEAARLVGLEGTVGRVAPGAWGDLIAVDLPSPPAGDPIEGVLAQSPQQVRLTLAGGRVVYRRGNPA